MLTPRSLASAPKGVGLLTCAGDAGSSGSGSQQGSTWACWVCLQAPRSWWCNTTSGIPQLPTRGRCSSSSSIWRVTRPRRGRVTTPMCAASARRHKPPARRSSTQSTSGASRSWRQRRRRRRRWRAAVAPAGASPGRCRRSRSHSSSRRSSRGKAARVVQAAARGMWLGTGYCRSCWWPAWLKRCWFTRLRRRGQPAAPAPLPQQTARRLAHGRAVCRGRLLGQQQGRPRKRRQQQPRPRHSQVLASRLRRLLCRRGWGHSRRALQRLRQRPRKVRSHGSVNLDKMEGYCGAF